MTDLAHDRLVQLCEDLKLPGVADSYAALAATASEQGQSFTDYLEGVLLAERDNPAHDISPAALEVVKRIDAIFDIEREINGLDAGTRQVARQDRCRPLVEDLHNWLLEERARMSKHNSVAKAIDYVTLPKDTRWAAFTEFLGDGRICLTNSEPASATSSREQANAERALRGIALGRKSWLFAGSERGGERAAFMYTLIVTAKMNDIDPQAWMADVLARLPNITVSHVHELLPWNWKAEQEAVKAA